MKSAAGLWIDPGEPVIVRVYDCEEEIQSTISQVEKHVRFSGSTRSEQAGGEDQVVLLASSKIFPRQKRLSR